MAGRKESAPDDAPTRHRAATTPVGRENQLINLAWEVAEKQLREGNVSAQVLTHYLKAGSSREYLEKQRLEMEVELQKAKVKQLASMARTEELIEHAIDAMRSYQTGEPTPAPSLDLDDA